MNNIFKYLQYISLIDQFIAFIRGAEGLFSGKGRGVEKLEFVRVSFSGLLDAAALTGLLTTERVEKIKALLDRIISLAVDLMKIFGGITPIITPVVPPVPAPAVPTPTPSPAPTPQPTPEPQPTPAPLPNGPAPGYGKNQFGPVPSHEELKSRGWLVGDQVFESLIQSEGPDKLWKIYRSGERPKELSRFGPPHVIQ